MKEGKFPQDKKQRQGDMGGSKPQWPGQNPQNPKENPSHNPEQKDTHR